MGNICANNCFDIYLENYQENKPQNNVLLDQHQNQHQHQHQVCPQAVNESNNQNDENSDDDDDNDNYDNCCFENMTLEQISREFNFKDVYFADCLYFKSNEFQMKNIKSFFNSAMLYQTFIFERLGNLLKCLKINQFTLADLFAFHNNSPVFALFWQEVFDDLYAVQDKQKNWKNTQQFREIIYDSDFSQLFADIDQLLGLFQDSKKKFRKNLKKGKFCFVNSILVKVIREFKEQTYIENPQFPQNKTIKTFQNYKCQYFAI